MPNDLWFCSIHSFVIVSFVYLLRHKPLFTAIPGNFILLVALGTHFAEVHFLRGALVAQSHLCGELLQAFRKPPFKLPFHESA